MAFAGCWGAFCRIDLGPVAVLLQDCVLRARATGLRVRAVPPAQCVVARGALRAWAARRQGLAHCARGRAVADLFRALGLRILSAVLYDRPRPHYSVCLGP